MMTSMWVNVYKGFNAAQPCWYSPPYFSEREARRACHDGILYRIRVTMKPR